ncbi:MAG: cobalamin biosynthesis protein CbiD [Paenibacillaceae bacterium]|jgi:cobalt-precorrin-5B (C1)-methyltransferase|nr:cobalamin biosynthesis protein CbiD [Paenibacillaceae bacterium]
MVFEHYIYKSQKKLRCGYTTGTCAALAAKAATMKLLGGETAERISIMTPKGIPVETEVVDLAWEEDFAQCAVRKDSGDDPDVTNGMLVYARVSRIGGRAIEIDGGTGVGRVTRRGLDQPVGAAAINRVPRQMIAHEVEELRGQYGYEGGIRVVISVPGGEETARKTFNPRLGIEGGISILGTSGIVEPMSEQALTESIRLELSRLKAEGSSAAVIAPGNYGEEYLRKKLAGLEPVTVKCSNFIGETLDHAVVLGFEKLLLVGHIGKFIKLAGGIMNTHSRIADARLELMTVHAVLAGADSGTVRELMNCATTDEGLEILERQGIMEQTMNSLMAKIGFHIRQRVGEQVWIEAIMFSNERGVLGVTDGADKLAKTLLEAML